MEQKYGDLPMSTVLKTNGADLRSFVAAKSVIERLQGIDKDAIPDSLDTDLKKELAHGLLASFKQKERLLKRRLAMLQVKHHHLLGEIRGVGLIWSIAVVNNGGENNTALSSNIQKALLNKGVLVRDVKSTLVFKVPIVATDTELEDAFAIIDSYLATLQH